MRTAGAACVVVALLLMRVSGPANTQQPTTAAQPRSSAPAEPKPGVIAESIECADSPGQTYAAYLPSHYSPTRKWPIVYAFDPGAEGIAPVRQLKDAAEEFGVIVVGSNNSRNGSSKAESDAAQAVWQDTHKRFALDDRQIFLSGFSGGARLASRLAQNCKCAAGVFLNGAGFSDGSPPTKTDSFPVFLSAGMRDFNYGELVGLDTQLDGLGYPHLLVRFDGRHDWAPPEVAREGLGWLLLQAIKQGRREKDPAFIHSQLAEAEKRAAELAAHSDTYIAWEYAHAMSATFSGLADALPFSALAARLEADPLVKKGLKHEAEEIAAQQSLEGNILGLAQSLPARSEERDQAVAELEHRVTVLRQQAEAHRNSVDDFAFERARMGVFAFFVEGGSELLESNQRDDAVTYLKLGALALPESPWPHALLARAYALNNRKKETIAELKRCRDTGMSGSDLRAMVERHAELRRYEGDGVLQMLLQ